MGEVVKVNVDANQLDTSANAKVTDVLLNGEWNISSPDHSLTHLT